MQSGHILKMFTRFFRVMVFVLILFFQRDSNPTRYDIKSELSLEEPGVIGPLFNFTFQVRAKYITIIIGLLRIFSLFPIVSVASQIQNLGYFPVKDLQLNIEIPEMTKNGNQLLQISDFSIDQVSVGPQSWLHSQSAKYLMAVRGSPLHPVFSCSLTQKISRTRAPIGYQLSTLFSKNKSTRTTTTRPL